MAESLALFGLALAVLAIYLSSLKRPDVRIVVPDATFFPLGIIEKKNGEWAAVRVVVPIYITNSGAKAGVFLELEPHPQARVRGRSLFKYSCAVRGEDDKEYELPAVVPAAGIILRTLNFYGHLDQSLNKHQKLEKAPAETDDFDMSVTFRYKTTGGMRLVPWRQGQPVIRHRSLEVTVELHSFDVE